MPPAAFWRGLKALLPWRRSARLAPRDAYRLWSTTYDQQPDNVVLRVESALFSDLLARNPIEDLDVLDVGCGTGRHWATLAARRPRSLQGADNSPEMLQRLQTKFPGAPVHLLVDWQLASVPDASIDVAISTLAIGHIRELARAIVEWARVVRPGGRAVVTDFHPEALRIGLTRTFTHAGRTIEAESHLHPVAELRALFERAGFRVLATREGIIDDTVQDLFERQNMAAAYQRYRGAAIVLGLELQRDATRV
jgi:ubiquinone/menaquinone biosynthesis C-methylase UbiE